MLLSDWTQAHWCWIQDVTCSFQQVQLQKIRVCVTWLQRDLNLKTLLIPVMCGLMILTSQKISWNCTGLIFLKKLSGSWSSIVLPWRGSWFYQFDSGHICNRGCAECWGNPVPPGPLLQPPGNHREESWKWASPPVPMSPLPGAQEQPL